MVRNRSAWPSRTAYQAGLRRPAESTSDQLMAGQMSLSCQTTVPAHTAERPAVPDPGGERSRLFQLAQVRPAVEVASDAGVGSVDGPSSLPFPFPAFWCASIAGESSRETLRPQASRSVRHAAGAW